MQPASDKEPEKENNQFSSPLWDGILTGFRTMRLLHLSPIRVETGGTKRSHKKVDWETLVDAVYAPKGKFSPN